MPIFLFLLVFLPLIGQANPVAECSAPITMSSLSFNYEGSGFYVDKFTGEEILAINPDQNKSATVTAVFPGTGCRYAVTLHGIGEEDGQSSFSFYVNGRKVGDAVMPLSDKPWEAGERYGKTFADVVIPAGAEIKVVGRVGTDGTEYSRARWQKLVFDPVGPEANQTYLHCGRLITAEDDEVREEMTVVVENGRITTVSKGYQTPPAGAEAVDLKDRTVMPGLIDLHVHIESQSSRTRYLEVFTQDPADVALRATVYCDKTLRAGFTTVRDLGGSGANVSLRDAIAAGYVDGPRIVTAEKAIGTTGGHADPTNGRSSELMGNPGPNEGVINGPDEAYAAVRARYKKGADCIKITATGGVLSVAKDGSGPQFTQEEADAIVAAAKDYGMHTAAHAHGNEGMRRAIRAGITTIEHGSLMDEETMDLMIEYGTYLVPTISAGRFVADQAKVPGFYPAIIVPKALAIGSIIQETFGKAYQRGVKIAFGTDSGVSYHGDNANEFLYMVEAGMPPLEALLSATRVAAGVLGMEEEIGRIRPGMAADIVAVPGNPLENIGVMKEVDFVMKGGIIFK